MLPWLWIYGHLILPYLIANANKMSDYYSRVIWRAINITYVCIARGLSIGERAMKGQFVVVMFYT
jgi:hypothetical protein